MPAREPPDTARRFIPPDPTLEKLREAAAGCTACPLHATGTQTVFGEGPGQAQVMFVGEQPGDKEDLSGHPFVGPAGQLLDRALVEAGIDRGHVYVTNAVKHFKWEQRGTRRIHSKPAAGEIRACVPWLEEEIRLVKPEIVVCLGATAAQALLGRGFKVTEQRGIFMQVPFASFAFATVHPSSLLRIPDEEQRRQAYARFVGELQEIAQRLDRAG